MIYFIDEPGWPRGPRRRAAGNLQQLAFTWVQIPPPAYNIEGEI